MKYEMENLITWEEPTAIRPHPKNRNKHSEEQVDRLAEIIKYQGWRHPLIISERSKYLVAGHGRLLAAKKLGLRTVPVHYQSFESDEQEYAFLVSDNAIASWAELDLKGINVDLADLGPDFDIDLLGIKDFVLDTSDFEPGSLEDQGKLDEKKPVECPSCGHHFTP